MFSRRPSVRTRDAQIASQTNPLEEEKRKAVLKFEKEVVIEKEKEKKRAPIQGPEFLVKMIVIVGNKLFKTEELLAQEPKLEGKRVSFEDLQKFADRITAFYQRHGYITSRAYSTAHSEPGRRNCRLSLRLRRFLGGRALVEPKAITPKIIDAHSASCRERAGLDCGTGAIPRLLSSRSKDIARDYSIASPAANREKQS